MDRERTDAMTDWAAKVLEGVPRALFLGKNENGYYLREADALAAIAKLGAGDGLVERLQTSCNCNFPETTCGAEDQCRLSFEAAAHIAALTAQNRELALDVLASSGQAQEAYAAQLAAEVERDALRAKVARLEGALKRVSMHRDIDGQITHVALIALAALTDGAADQREGGRE